MLRTLVVLCVLLLWSEVSCAQKCSAPRSRAVKFSVNSRRNNTGHWIAEAKLDHSAGQEEAGPWEVDIEHETATCGDDESIHITALVKAPPGKTFQQMGYELLPGFGYYKLHIDIKTWDEALVVCEEEGAHLLIINSETEAKALGPFWDKNPNIIHGPPNSWAFAGFHQKYKEKEFLTIFNQSLSDSGYVKWNAGEPNGGNQKCGCVFRRENMLGDILCNVRQPFFCEKEHDF